MNTPLEQYIRSRLIIAVAIVFGIGFAIFAGKLHGSGKTLELFVIFGAIALTFLAVKYQDKLWVLIPAGWWLTGKVTVLPVPFSIRDIIVMYVATVIAICMALKIVKTKPKYTAIDVLLLINFLWLLSVYIRNPVGVDAFGSSRVGGKPYFDAVIAYITYLIIIRIKTTPAVLRKIPFYTLAVAGLIFLITLFIYWKPSLAPIAIALYSGFNLPGLITTAHTNIPEMSYETTRFSYFKEIGSTLFLLVIAYYNPLKALIPIYWKQFWPICFACFAILISGFRSALADAAIFFFCVVYFRQGMLVAIRSILPPIAIFYLLLIGNHNLYELPYGADRTFAFIPESLRPVKLDPVAVNDAQESTRWRKEMWEDALNTSKYISNKWLGDGFGLTKWQLQVSQALVRNGSTWEDGQESMAIAGAFHSGPVSTIRYVGYIGLILLYIYILLLARMSFRIIKATRGSPLFPVALFFGVPIVVRPIVFTFIFGAYDNEIVSMAFALGMLKMIENTHQTWVMNKRMAPSKKANSLPALPLLQSAGGIKA